MPRDRDDVPRSFRLLYLCTGNICRSPFAEVLTRHLLTARLGTATSTVFHIASAGTRAVTGVGVHPATRAELEQWGLHRSAADRFVARQVHAALIEQSDLVLGATLRHRSAAVRVTPVALTSAFGLREFARLAASIDRDALPADPVARAHAMVGQALARRGLVAPASPDDDDVPDPMGGPPLAHREAAELIREAVATIVDVIAPRSTSAIDANGTLTR